MKKNLPTLVGLLAIACAQPSQAQAPCDIKGIITDPAQPAVNPEYPTRTNTFNWYYGQQYGGRWWNLNNAAINERAIWMPWEQSDNTSMLHILGKRDYPKDGWELLKQDLGYDDNGVPVTGSRNPYVVLYNKRSGMLRVFVAMGELFNSYQFAEIKLSFADRKGALKKAGTLNRMEGIGTALENTVPGTGSTFVAMTPFLNQRAKWFMADFPMDYDPCVCQFDSKFIIDVRLISQADVKLQGVTNGTLVTTDVNNPGATKTGDSGQSPNLMKKASDAVSAGQKTYSSLNDFASSVKDKLTIQGTKSDAADATAKKNAVDKLTAALAKNDFLKAGLKALPYVGAAVSALDAFFGGGKEESTPAPIALQPMTLEMNTTTTGTITASSLYANINFNNPGTRTITTREQYPYYNEALGVFSLLTRPTVQYRNTTYRDMNGVSSRRYEFKVPQALQYVINPASGLEVQDFQVALVQNANEYYPDQRPLGWEYEGISATSGSSHVFRTPYVDASCLPGRIFALETKDPRYQTEASEVVISPSTDRTFLKFILNLRRPGAPATEQNTLIVLKYPVTVQQVSTFSAGNNQACGTVLAQASTGTVQSFCASSTYANAMNLRTTAPKPAIATTSTMPAVDAVQVYPNPATDVATLRFDGTATGTVSAYLTDMLGRRVLTIMQPEAVVPGEQRKAFSTADLPAGLYRCVVETAAGYRATSALSVVR